jgi:3-methyladenine DNA glycosylase AlkD
MKERIVEETRKLIAAYEPEKIAETASKLQEIWLEAVPEITKGARLIKREQREKLKAVGTPVPVLKAIGKEVGKRAKRRVEDFIPLIVLLWDEYGREGRLVAATALGPMELSDPDRIIPIIYELAKTSISWEDCDQLAMEALEPIVRKRPEEYLERLWGWVSDENKWVRRVAITVIGRLPMKRADYTRRCLEMVEPAFGDKDLDVRRALSFAIRMGARGDPGLVRDFLATQLEQRSDPASVWVLCDVIRSMTKKLLPEFRGLLPAYERLLETVEEGSRRSIESAIKVLRR